MRWREVGDSLCPVAQTAAIIGDRWTLLILREALQGARRFDAFESVLGISPHLLSVRLKRLIAEDIMRKDGHGNYRLTKAGVALQTVILSLAAWGNQWRSAENGPQSVFIHTDCGHAFEPHLSCSSCSQPVAPAAVETKFSEALTAERAVRK